MSQTNQITIRAIFKKHVQEEGYNPSKPKNPSSVQMANWRTSIDAIINGNGGTTVKAESVIVGSDAFFEMDIKVNVADVDALTQAIKLAAIKDTTIKRGDKPRTLLPFHGIKVGVPPKP